MTKRRRRVAAGGRLVVALVAGCTLLTACGIGMPQSGPVVESRSTGASGDDDATSFNPRGPRLGDSPEEIVRGFLEAMEATPAVSTSVAREFLTEEAAATWQPDGMVIYDSYAIPRGNLVQAQLDDAHRTDARGAWLGALPAEDATLDFPVELEDGEWRLSEPPPWLVVSQTWFEQRFQPASLYFFDPTVSTLVPEPVFVPGGPQFASSLVNGLLQGPSAELAGTEQNFLPPNLRSIVSVPVSAGGVASVELTSDTEDVPLPSAEEAELLVAQLAWTLRQDPSITRFRVSIDDQPVVVPGEGSEYAVDVGHDVAPYLAGSSTQLFGVREGVMVGGSPQNLATVAGPFGSGDYALRAVAADLRAEKAAAVSASGGTLWVGPVRDIGSSAAAVLTDGEDLLRPAWDSQGRLWIVDRRSTGAVVSYWWDDQLRTLQVDGVSGADVRDVLVSRDGSRLVAVLRDGARDRVVVSRILGTGDGQVDRALPATDLTTLEDVPGRVRDIAWRSPTSLVVLLPAAGGTSRVRSISVDGSAAIDALSVPLTQEVRGLVGTPLPGEDSYALTATGLIDLASPLSGELEIDPGVTGLDYAG